MKKLNLKKTIKCLIATAMVICLTMPVYAKEPDKKSAMNEKMIISEAAATESEGNAESEKVKINFVHNPANAGRVDVINHTQNTETDVRTDSIEVNKGDVIDIHAYGLPGYGIIGMYCNDRDCFSNYDENVTVEEELTYTMFYFEEVFNLSIDQDTVDFGKVKAGYEPVPEQKITLTNDGEEPLSLQCLESDYYEITKYEGENVIESGNERIILGGTTCTFTVQPKDGLEPGKYSEVLNIYHTTSDPKDDDALVGSINVTFEVTSANEDVTKPDDNTTDPIDKNQDSSDKENNIEETGNQSDVSVVVKPAVPKESTNPKTGDSAPVMLYGIISISAVAVVAYLMKKRKGMN